MSPSGGIMTPQLICELRDCDALYDVTSVIGSAVVGDNRTCSLPQSLPQFVATWRHQHMEIHDRNQTLRPETHHFQTLDTFLAPSKDGKMNKWIGRVPSRCWVPNAARSFVKRYLTLVQDTFETFWDARVDLWERRLRKHGKKVLESTQTALRKRGIEGDAFAKDLDKELSRYKTQVRANVRRRQW